MQYILREQLFCDFARYNYINNEVSYQRYHHLDKLIDTLLQEKIYNPYQPENCYGTNQ